MTHLSRRFWFIPVVQAICATVCTASALAQPSPVRTIQFDSQRVEAIAVSPTSETLAIAMRGQMELVEIPTGTVSRTISTDDRLLWCITFTADGQGVVGVDGEKSARLWPLSPKLQERSFRVPNESPQIAACSPTSHLLAIDGKETKIQIFDYTAGKRKLLLEGHTGGIFAAAFSPDGKSLVSGGGDGKVIIWSLNDRNAPRRIATHGPVGDWVCDVTYSPDGKTIASCSSDKIKFWNSATGEQAAAIAGLPRTVSRVRYAPDGTMLVAACGDGQIVVCNAMTGAQERRVKAHDQSIYGLEMSADGKWLVSWNLDKVKIWNAAEFHSQTGTP